MANLTTLAQVKALMGVEVANLDARINALIPIISEWAQAYCGRAFFTAEHTEYHDGGAPDILLNEYPLSDTVAPVVRDIAYPGDSGTIVNASEYFVDKTTGQLHMDGGNWAHGFRRFSVVYTAGYGATLADMPAGLTGAVAMWVSSAFRINTDGDDMIATQEPGNDYSLHAVSSRLPVGGIKAALDLYRRPQL